MLEGKALPPAKGLMLPVCPSSLTVLTRDLGCPCGECTAAYRTDCECRAQQVAVKSIPYRSSPAVKDDPLQTAWAVARSSCCGLSYYS